MFRRVCLANSGVHRAHHLLASSSCGVAIRRASDGGSSAAFGARGGDGGSGYQDKSIPSAPRNRNYGADDDNGSNGGSSEDSATRLWILKLIKFVRWLKSEFDKGPSHPPVAVVYGVTLAYASWYIFKYYMMPYREQTQEMPFRLRIPFVDSHNAFFGIMPSLTDARDPASILSTRELDRPGLIATERSEAYNVKLMEDGSIAPADAGSKRTDLVVAQMQDWDEGKELEVYYRSVHYVTTTVQGKKSAEEVAKTKRSAQPIFHRTAEPEPLGGSDNNILRGMVRCKALTPTNNCMLDSGHLDLEYTRKMMVALGPLFMLRNPLDAYFPLRVTDQKETKSNVLICGLGSGALASFLNRSYPHLRLDVCEKDGAIVRVARKFLGFREVSGMNLFLEEPSEFMRRMQIAYPHKYDMIMLDCLQDENGRVPIEYSRLEFLTSVRNSLSSRGLVVANIPNRDENIFQSTVANWRMAFDGRSVLLIHCATSPNSILMTFADDSGRGEPKFGTVGDVNEFKELLRAQLKHFRRRVPFDLLGEVNETNFQQMEPGKRYYFARKEKVQNRHGRPIPQQGPEGPITKASEGAVWATPDHALSPYALQRPSQDTFIARFLNFYSAK